jgi:hypothetical protein
MHNKLVPWVALQHLMSSAWIITHNCTNQHMLCWCLQQTQLAAAAILLLLPSCCCPVSAAAAAAVLLLLLLLPQLVP